MNHTSNELFKAVRHALYAGAAAVVGLSATPVLAQDDTNSQRLDTITVTGSNIRRVDIETANPVVTIDRAQIQKTGKLTIGDIIQELPSISGAATNPSVNNGGGSGASTVSLRGLGSARTLLLLNGRRLNYNDVNSIPANLVDRIEVLKDGASAIYGSDAIGGVVNFITRKDYQGAEISLDYGVSDHDDGARKGVSLTLGHTSEKGSLVLGLNYNKTDPVWAGNRDFSAFPLYNYFGNIYVLGSPTIPNGRYVIPRARAEELGITGCGTGTTVSVTRIAGAAGTSPSDFRCYVGAGANNDTYNYAPDNLELTPQERGSLFVAGSYKLSDSVEAYLEAVTTHTTSSSIIAAMPLSFNGTQGASISADSVYNPFGVDITTGGIRPLGTGQRQGKFVTQADQITGGLRGAFGDTSWTWDAGVTWARTTQWAGSTGHYFLPGLRQATGPSFIDADGVARCGTPDAVIAGCTPVNMFALDPNTAAGQEGLALLSKYWVTPTSSEYVGEKTAYFNVSGELFQLPAGALSLAVGGDYVKDYDNFQPDYIETIVDADTGACLSDGETCSSPSKGKLSRKEIYAELFVPVLKDLPFVRSLNLSLGSRYSDYSAFGSTTNSKLSVEWRPIDDLLLRATASEVFRAPTIGDLFGGVTPSANTVSDPCSGAGYIAGNPACAGVSPGYVQTVQQPTTLFGANAFVKPEVGKVITWGVVYDPEWLQGFSTTVDFWRVFLHDTIGTLGSQTILDQCYFNGKYCNLFTREATGDIFLINDTTNNVGRTDTNGVDFSVKYRLPEFAFGRFTVGLDTTYIKRYAVESVQGDISTRGEWAGSFFGSAFGGDGAYSRVRALGSVDWNLGAFDASWRARYLSAIRFGNTCQTGGGYNVICPGGDPTNGTFRFGAYTMHSLQFGYNVEPINTRFELGIDNVFDKQPPLLYQFGFNGNTDERSYDVVGRYYWGRVSVKF